MVANNQAKSRSEAQAIAQQMLASKLIVNSFFLLVPVSDWFF